MPELTLNGGRSKVIQKEKAFTTEDTESTKEDSEEGFYSATSNSVSFLCVPLYSLWFEVLTAGAKSKQRSH